MRIYADLLSPVGLKQSTKHLVGRLCGGKLSNHIRILGLHETYPARAAGGEHRELVLSRMCQLMQEFAGLLQNGLVSCEVGVEYIVETKLLEAGNQSVLACLCAGHAEILAPCSTNSGSYLYDCSDIGICQSSKYFISIVSLCQSASRAVDDTLAAESAVSAKNLTIVGYINLCVTAGTGDIPDIQALNLVADLYAAHTFDTLCNVFDQRSFLIPEVKREILRERVLMDVQIICKSLQGAVSAAYAAHALTAVLGHKELNIELSGLAHAGAVGMNNHAFLYSIVTGGNQTLGALYLYNTDTAGSNFINSF
jgi:hypothetical protein